MLMGKLVIGLQRRIQYAKGIKFFVLGIINKIIAFG